MTVKKIWMTGSTSRKSRYAWRTMGGIFGIAALMLLLVAGGVLLMFQAGLPREAFSLILCLGVTVLGTWLGLRLGKRTAQDGTVFVLTAEGKLYGLQAADLAGSGRNVLAYAEGTLRTQALLRKLEEKPFLPAAADEIRRVETIREHRTEYVVRCRVRRPGGHSALRTFFVAGEVEEADQLLQELERRQSWENDLEPKENLNPLGILLSAAALAILVVLCVLSHPAQAQLPQVIYFPCLAGAVGTFGVMAYFILRQHRGE